MALQEEIECFIQKAEWLYKEFPKVYLKAYQKYINYIIDATCSLEEFQRIFLAAKTKKAAEAASTLYTSPVAPAAPTEALSTPENTPSKINQP